MWGIPLLLALTFVSVADAQDPPLPNSFPHLYKSIPNPYENFSDSKAWQNYFRVTDKLPNVTFPLTENFAGNIPVGREGHRNNTLFFWAFSKNDGSLTRSTHENDTRPWMIWLNGGPGSSSLIGALLEHGPIRLQNDGSVSLNKYAWNTEADIFYVDNPVGTGYSTADTTGYIADDTEMAKDFIGFLANLVQIFPSLAHRPCYITGESYAGHWVPYIVANLLSLQDPLVNLAGYALGDATVGPEAVYEDVPVIQVIETYPQLINFDADAYKYFKNQHHLCGHDVILTYPQINPLPVMRDLSDISEDALAPALRGRTPRSLTRNAFRSALSNAQRSSSTLDKRDLERRQENMLAWKRDLSMRSNDSIDPWYECFLIYELFDYVTNFTAPWANSDFDVYNIPDALSPEAPTADPESAAVFLNDPRTRAALHAPTSKNWTASFNYPFGNQQNPASNPGTDLFGNPSPPASSLLPELVAKGAEKGIRMLLYSGNDDALVGHFGTLATIQNTTFCGTRGFTREPSTTWYDDDGTVAGLIHQECGVGYLLFKGVGHLIPQTQPQRALKMLREFILGNSKTGLVLPNGTVVGGEGFKLVNGIMPGERNPIFTGSGTTMGSTLWPSATIAAWDSFIATATATATARSRAREFRF